MLMNKLWIGAYDQSELSVIFQGASNNWQVTLKICLRRFMHHPGTNSLVAANKRHVSINCYSSVAYNFDKNHMDTSNTYVKHRDHVSLDGRRNS